MHRQKNSVGHAGDAPTNPHSLQGVFEESYREIFAFVRGKVGAGPPDPDDIVQQAFAKYAALADRSAIGNPTAFLIRTAGNLIKDHARKSSTRFNVSVNGAELDFVASNHDDLSPEIVLLGRERFQCVVAALKELPRRRRRFVLLNRLEGMSYVEIARMSGTSESTVRKEVKAGVATCRRALAKLMGDEDS
ncbi:RNA polymerase sigma factor [Henriciella aquimarina]|uniref:RNA polymerase sigma factor n=1 Tax=Henriciella aquimarina TaxID=545261 RepID=UPI001301CD0C|nr:RNA polymerase sigma factor [Henriciella aquimarina]